MYKIKENTEEYYNLKTKLSDLGLYDEGMDFDQMQKIDLAVNESVLDQDDNADFSNNSGEFFSHNSTMISFSGNPSTFESGFISHESCAHNNSLPSSPINISEKFVVIAQVHHELDYSPESTREQKTEEIMNKRKSEKYKKETNNINDSVNENYMMDSGVYLEAVDSINYTKNKETFFKNVSLLK